MENYTITNNKRQSRFEAILPDGEIAVLEYRWLKARMVLMHTVVPATGRKKGVGSDLVKYVLEHAREHHLKLIVYCQFVAEYMKRHPEYDDLLGE